MRRIVIISAENFLILKSLTLSPKKNVRAT